MVAEIPVQFKRIAVPSDVQVPEYGWGKDAPPPVLRTSERAAAEISAESWDVALSLLARRIAVEVIQRGGTKLFYQRNVPRCLRVAVAVKLAPVIVNLIRFDPGSK